MTPKVIYYFFSIWVSKIRRISRLFQICGKSWKKVHPEKVICLKLFGRGLTPIFHTFFASNFFLNNFEISKSKLFWYPFSNFVKKKCLGHISTLNVDGNENLGGLRFLQLLGIGLGLWRSMSIFILNVLFAIEKHISCSALSSKLNRRCVWQKALWIKQDLPTYNAPIYLRTECLERCSARDWDGKDYLRIIPRVVW
jgi:hypothetical protein